MKKILIVEDHIDIRKLLKMTLEFDDFEIHEAATGDAGWVLAQELQPDIVLLDVMMPGVDGYETARRLKADPATASVPVILLTARVGGDPAADVAVGVIAKPFDPMNLAGQVRSILGWPS